MFFRYFYFESRTVLTNNVNINAIYSRQYQFRYVNNFLSVNEMKPYSGM
jgi:hypothetical protein